MSEDFIKLGWKAPSNIALVKYWGKKENQIPANASLSITLDYATTSTFLSFKVKKVKDNRISLTYFFHQVREEKFENKIAALLNRLIPEMPFLVDYELVFHSENNFPHSTGIASSASSMAALALCLVHMEILIKQTHQTKETFFQRASYIARLGSGSASRSIYGGLVTWGAVNGEVGTSDLFASPFNLDETSRLNSVRDIILIVSSQEKSMSSSIGHSQMEQHPYRNGRINQANANISELLSSVRTSDYANIAKIAEIEALSLHALLMTSGADGFLLKPNTLQIIDEIKRFRNEHQLDLFFTIDAGPNVHLIYYEDQREQVLSFVERTLSIYCEDGKWIDDKIGEGPVCLTPQNLDLE
jgi:diphosphomevalonate decarboxylase